MIKINPNLQLLEDINSFSKIKEIFNEYKVNHPTNKIISLAIGDVSKPINKYIIAAMHKAVDDLSDMNTFSGYGNYYGINSLKEKILENDYKDFDFSIEEIYISNGTKTDSTSILELFDINSKICVVDPMYPIYKEGSLCLNRNVYVLETINNDYYSNMPKEKYDIIYLCSPSNPVGVAISYEELTKWVNYAMENNAVIIYDNVYEAFITTNKPHSIYEINGAKKVAIELRSFSKKASFTGVRCSYYIIPNEIGANINKLWQKRTINRFNGADYIAQKGAEASYLKESKLIIADNIKYYLDNAKILKDIFEKYNYEVMGGEDSPFLWIKSNNKLNGWDIFKFFLEELNIIIVPGIIFGKNGINYFRVSALGDRNNINEVIERMDKYYEKNN